MIRHLCRWLVDQLDPVDPAWKATGVRQVFTGHDEAKGVAAYRRSLRHTESGRVFRRSKPASAAESNVTPMRRRRSPL